MENKDHSDTACTKLSEDRLVYWARLPGWRLREAAALLLDLDPDDQNTEDQSTFRDLQRILLRARSMKVIHSPIRPRRFLDWAASNNINIPEQLQSEVLGQSEIIDWRKRALRRGRQIARLKSERSQADINPKSKNTAERFFLCMALKWYRLGPPLNVNFNLKKMLGDVTINDKEMISDGTIRGWIADARSHQSDILDEATRVPDENRNTNLQMQPGQARPR